MYQWKEPILAKFYSCYSLVLTCNPGFSPAISLHITCFMPVPAHQKKLLNP